MRRGGAVLVAAALLAVVLLAAGCASDDAAEVPDLFPGDNSALESEVTTDQPTTTTLPVSERLPTLATDVLGAVRAEDGTARGITGTDGEVWFIPGACGGDSIAPAATANLIGAQHVVLDPAGGGADRGSSSGGVVEAEVMLDIAERTAAALRELGVAVILTRTTDTDMSASVRGSVAPAVGAVAFVSLQLADAGRTTVAEPAPEVIHQAAGAQSRRLGGLLHEELAAALASEGDEWSALEEPGVRPLLNQRGDDFHAVIRSAAPGAGVLLEMMALGENEAALLASEEGRRAVIDAVTAAIVRFLVTEEAGSGFLEPDDEVRTAPTSNAPGGC